MFDIKDRIRDQDKHPKLNPASIHWSASIDETVFRFAFQNR